MRHRRDSTHKQIKADLEAMGFSVADTSQIGGLPDLVIGKVGRMAWVECKSPKGLLDAQARLREGQREFAAHWRGGKVITSYTADSAVLQFNEGL